MTLVRATGAGTAPPGPPPLASPSLRGAVELLRALSTPHRLAIVLALAEEPRCVHELVDLLGISQSLTSQHLGVLRHSGLVVGVRRGKETRYSLSDPHVGRIAREAVAQGVEPASAAGGPRRARP